MKYPVGAAVMLLCITPAFANDIAMLRILSCKGPDAAMEVFVRRVR